MMPNANTHKKAQKAQKKDRDTESKAEDRDLLGLGIGRVLGRLESGGGIGHWCGKASEGSVTCLLQLIDLGQLRRDCQ